MFHAKVIPQGPPEKVTVGRGHNEEEGLMLFAKADSLNAAS